MTQIEKILADSTVLDPNLHRPLMREVGEYAHRAGVHVHMIWTPLSELASPTEVEWVPTVPTMRQQGPYGLVYVGEHFDPPVETRFMASAAACIRNFVDARVIPLHRLIEQLKNQSMDCSVLFVPNFSVGEEDGGYLPKWMKGILLDMLYDRLSHQQLTILGVKSMKSMEKGFGEAFASVIKDHYQRVTK